jgi:hypothetical protein
MTVKSDHLAEVRQTFVRQWYPDDPRSRHDFEIGLDRVIYAAFAAAQEPFIRELEEFKRLAMAKAWLTPAVASPDAL